MKYFCRICKYEQETFKEALEHQRLLNYTTTWKKGCFLIKAIFKDIGYIINGFKVTIL